MDAEEVNKPLIPDSRPETIRKSVETSLKRLQTDHIDLYYQHRPDPQIPVEEVAGVMSELIAEGKITHWGLSEADEDMICRAHRICPVTAIQNRYSMMARWHTKLFPILEELNIGFVAFSPLANGFLSARYNKDSVFEAGTDYRSVMPQFTEEGMKKWNAFGFAAPNSRRKAGDTGPDFSCLDDDEAPLYCSDSRNKENRSLVRKCRGG